MWKSLLEEFELFFVMLPPNVRDDLSFMMVVLSDESLVVRDVAQVYERAAQGLFNANSRMGRIGNLINAVSVLDVYFAMDVHNRFDAHKARPRGARRTGMPSGPYAREIVAIETAKQRWVELRATRFTPEAIAAALIPPAPPRRGTRRFPQSPQAHSSELSEVSRGTVS